MGRNYYGARPSERWPEGTGKGGQFRGGGGGGRHRAGGRSDWLQAAGDQLGRRATGRAVVVQQPTASPAPWAQALGKQAARHRRGSGPVLAGALLEGPAGERPDLREALRPVFEGTFGGLTTHIIDVDVEEGVASVVGRITAPDGTRVGKFIRQFSRDDDGKLVAKHDYLTLDEQVQGQNMSQEFNRRLIDWYRQSGVDRIELTANIDVGGYSWARSGYNWKRARTAEKVFYRLEKQLQKLEAGDVPPGMVDVPAQVAAAKELLERARTVPFGQLGYPTAYDVSELGRPQGATRNDKWLGKLVLLGSSWNGVRYL